MSENDEKKYQDIQPSFGHVFTDEPGLTTNEVVENNDKVFYATFPNHQSDRDEWIVVYWWK